MKQTDPQMKIRLPPNLKSEIERSAVANNRSMNAEIVDRLKRSLCIVSESTRAILLDENGKVVGAASLSDLDDERTKRLKEYVSNEIRNILREEMDRVVFDFRRDPARP